MIITRTPYRVSLAGGLSDIPAYYENTDNLGHGCVVSTSIDRYIYIAVAERFDKKFRLSYSRTEEEYSVEDIKHPIIRECLKYLEIETPLEVVSFSSIPGRSGLGSSSAYTVGLLNALYNFKGHHVSKRKLAEDASKIEIDILKEPIGKQDQYATAFGGINKFVFFKDNVEVHPLTHIMKWETLQELEQNILLFYTDIQRYASSVLSHQKKNIEHSRLNINEIREIAFLMYTQLYNNDLSKIGDLINKNWVLKKSTGNVSNQRIDVWYNSAIRAGASGGKISGAGGGGFLMIYCKPEYQERVRQVLSQMNELKFHFEDEGTKVIYNDG